ncbi:MAG: glucosaminidase domain-containing protein [Candidatus Gracilibacteria bacterium]|nr:glucosaminidase domain-containing protein [Candidatus Gracilibacteria bacterium]
MFFFFDISFASESKKVDFISAVLPKIEKAKDDLGGVAEKIPVSLVLAQAIHESGWGTSNFAKNKKNLFGIKTVAVVASKSSKPKKKMVYKSFRNIELGIKYYLSNYVNNDDYKDFRKHLKHGTTALIKHLGPYAEDPSYAKKLRKIIDDNNLLVYDAGLLRVKLLASPFFYV